MTISDQHTRARDVDPGVVGPTCEQSALSPVLRLVITLGVLFALKWSLPAFGLSPILQVIVLLAVATVFARLFWWRCNADRRGVMLLIGSLWVAGLVKILMIR